MSVIDTINIASLVINIVLIIVSVSLAVASWKDSQNKKSQVKIWMEQANGVQQGLQNIIEDKWRGLYSGVNDITNAIWAVKASAFALYQSLYDERVITEKEYKEHQMKIRAQLDKQFKLNKRKTTSAKK